MESIISLSIGVCLESREECPDGVETSVEFFLCPISRAFEECVRICSFVAVEKRPGEIKKRRCLYRDTHCYGQQVRYDASLFIVYRNSVVPKSCV